MLTDLRVGQTQAIGAASTEPFPNYPAGPRTGGTSVNPASVYNFHSINSSSSFKGTRFHMPASRPQFPLVQPRTGPDVTLRVHSPSLRINRDLS